MAGHLDELLKRAEQGDEMAQSQMGSRYFYGQYAPQHYTEAIKWYSKAADQGCAFAQCKLGDMYALGLGVVQDYVEAAKWYGRSVVQGYTRDARYKLGWMYARGEGVPKDYLEAHMWVNLALARTSVDRSDPERKSATEALAEFQKSMTAVEIAEAQEKALEWHKNH